MNLAAVPLIKRRSVLPGFGLTLGYTVLYLSLIVLIPLSALFFNAATASWDHIGRTLSDPRVLSAFRLSLGASLAAAAVNAVFGLAVAWMLVRYRWLGRWLYGAGIASTNSWLGVALALTFIGLPFVVRTLQPALEDLDPEVEEAAASLGAGRLSTFLYVVFPAIRPALLTGFALAFARALGEYGSVIFIAGNMPMKTEIVPLVIVMKLEQYDYTGATAIAAAMLVLSFLLLLAINGLQWWTARHRMTR